MIEKIHIEPGCISCRNCENIAPDTFKVAPKSQVISHDYEWKTTQIIQAELLCPVKVIKVKKVWNISISLQEAKLVEKKQLTWDVIELVFDTDNFSAKPWQYVSLQMSDWKWLFYRNYSITDYNNERFKLTIKLLSDGRWAKFIKKLNVNKKLKFLGWIWSFVLQNTKKKKVFFATSTWISPIISMLKCIPDNIEKIVYFWVRNEEDIFYKELIQSIPNTKLELLLSWNTESINWNFPVRISEYVYHVNKESEVYICWNPSMMEKVTHKLLDQWHSKYLIYSEGFVMWKEERSVWKNIVLKWNIPWIHLIDKFLPILALIWIPVLYYYWIENNILHKSWFMWHHSISSLLFLISWYSVVFVMLIRPIADLLPKLWFLRKLSSLRKAVAILWSTVIVTIFLDKYFVNYENFTQYFTISYWNSLYPILSRSSELTWLILLATSNTLSQQKLGKYWKPLQRLAYLYFIAWWLIAAQWWSQSYYYTMWLWILLFIAAEVKNRFFIKD
jgi:NAD(P)H-flavin reductase/ferredoxin/DMSO/TMAO reductase YedYZ heme-binding membrane subunit